MKTFRRKQLKIKGYNRCSNSTRISSYIMFNPNTI